MFLYLTSMLNPCLRHVELSYYKSYDINKNTAKILRDFAQPLLSTHLVFIHVYIEVFIYVY